MLYNLQKIILLDCAWMVMFGLCYNLHSVAKEIKISSKFIVIMEIKTKLILDFYAILYFMCSTNAAIKNIVEVKWLKSIFLKQFFRFLRVCPCQLYKGIILLWPVISCSQAF